MKHCKIRWTENFACNVSSSKTWLRSNYRFLPKYMWNCQLCVYFLSSFGLFILSQQRPLQFWCLICQFLTFHSEHVPLGVSSAVLSITGSHPQKTQKAKLQILLYYQTAKPTLIKICIMIKTTNYTSRTVSKCTTNPRWRTAAILKIIICTSAYNDEIMQYDAECHCKRYQMLKFHFFF